MKILNFKGVGFGYPGQALILSGVNFALEEGERVALLGPNACGKSTFAALAAGILSPGSGEIRRGGNGKAQLRVGIVFQNSRPRIIGSTVAEDLGFGLTVLNYPSAQIRKKVNTYLELFDLEAKRDSGPDQLSGGELRRLALAAVLITDPELLILDEPLTMLDSFNQAVFLYYLQNRLSPGTSLIWLDHDIRSIRYGAKFFIFTRERQISPVSLSQLNNQQFLREAGLEPAPLQWVEWRFPERVSRAIYGPEIIDIDGSAR
jgi:energy-coupling factor transporter ATP-binding protein EcfA2